LAVSFFTRGSCDDADGALTDTEAGLKIISFINENLMAPGTKATLDSINEEAGVYKMIISAEGESITSYATKDGKTFFPQAFELEDIEKQIQIQKAAAQQEDMAAANMEKTDRPKVEIFVMSYCPYGTQIQKGIIPVIETLGSKADIELKFCDYAMQGEKELKEQLNQYCIQKEQNDKFIPYLKCFLEAGNTEKCITDAGIDRAKLSACVSSADAKYSVMADFKSKENYRGQFPGFAVHKTETAKYGVQGSPTVVINGVTVRSGRDPASLQKEICNAFTDSARPAECDIQMDSSTPSPGFGYSAGSAAGSDASCG